MRKFMPFLRVLDRKRDWNSNSLITMSLCSTQDTTSQVLPQKNSNKFYAFFRLHEALANVNLNKFLRITYWFANILKKSIVYS